MKTCTHCKTDKPQDSFRINAKIKDGLHVRCKVCESAYRKHWYAKNKEKVRESNASYYSSNFDKLRNEGLQKRYGISEQDYASMLAKQGGRCAICDTHQDSLKKVLSVDHNHVSGAVRGLLCQLCNTGVGVLKGDNGASLLLKAAQYIGTHDV